MKIRKNIAVSDTGFLFNPSTGDSFSINPIGQSIIKAFQDNKSEDEIIIELLEEYRIDKNTVEKDLNDFIRMLKNYQLID